MNPGQEHYDQLLSALHFWISGGATPGIGFEGVDVQESWSEHAWIPDGLSTAPVAIPSIDFTGRKKKKGQAVN